MGVLGLPEFVVQFDFIPYVAGLVGEVYALVQRPKCWLLELDSLGKHHLVLELRIDRILDGRRWQLLTLEDLIAKGL